MRTLRQLHVCTRSGWARLRSPPRDPLARPASRATLAGLLPVPGAAARGRTLRLEGPPSGSVLHAVRRHERAAMHGVRLALAAAGLGRSCAAGGQSYALSARVAWEEGSAGEFGAGAGWPCPDARPCRCVGAGLLDRRYLM